MKIFSIITAFLIVSTAGNAQGTFKPADRVYNKSGDYVRGFFGGETPKKSSVWVTGKLRDSVEQIINGADSIPLRYSYWRNEDRTTWVLDSIGHTWPITAGIVVENGKIIDISVLVYRESRGHEIQNRLHRAQYYEAEITKNNRLNKPINGISGSTLSVNSLKRMARVALLLHNEVTKEN